RDERRIGLERTLHAFAGGHLAHDERGAESPIALGDHDALVGLYAAPLALDHVDVHDHGIAGGERRNGLAQPGDLFLLQLLDEVRCWSRLARLAAASQATDSGAFCPPLTSSSSRACVSLSSKRASRSGRRCQVRPSACFMRQRSIAAWLPESSTSGTRLPS